MTKKESVITATYEILKPHKYSGVATFIFRSKLRERLQSYNDEMIRDLEEILINYEWVLRDKKSKLLIPTKKLLYTSENRLTQIKENIAISVGVENRKTEFLNYNIK